MLWTLSLSQESGESDCSGILVLFGYCDDRQVQLVIAMKITFLLVDPRWECTSQLMSTHNSVEAPSQFFLQRCSLNITNSHSDSVCSIFTCAVRHTHRICRPICPKQHRWCRIPATHGDVSLGVALGPIIHREPGWSLLRFDANLLSVYTVHSIRHSCTIHQPPSLNQRCIPKRGLIRVQLRRGIKINDLASMLLVFSLLCKRDT